MPEQTKFPHSRFSVRAPMSRLSLAAKLYSVFALFAVLIAAITALSDYNSRRNAELTEAVETASRAALNVQHVNSLVYAVVMESRGVYMSTDTAGAKKFGDGLLKFNDQILDRGQKLGINWCRPMTPSSSPTFKKRIEQFVEFRKELVRRGVEISPPPAANGATTMPIAKCVPPSTRISKRCPRSMPNAASDWRNRPRPITNWLFC